MSGTPAKAFLADLQERTLLALKETQPQRLKKRLTFQSQLLEKTRMGVNVTALLTLEQVEFFSRLINEIVSDTSFEEDEKPGHIFRWASCIALHMNTCRPELDP